MIYRPVRTLDDVLAIVDRAAETLARGDGSDWEALVVHLAPALLSPGRLRIALELAWVEPDWLVLATEALDAAGWVVTPRVQEDGSLVASLDDEERDEDAAEVILAAVQREVPEWSVCWTGNESDISLTPPANPHRPAILAAAEAYEAQTRAALATEIEDEGH